MADGQERVAAITRGPVHVLDAGRYYAEVVDGVPMIFRADTAGAVLSVESHSQSTGSHRTFAERCEPPEPPAASTSATKPCGTCARCGGTLYEYLTHFCSTSVRISDLDGFRLTPWGTWEWRPW